MCGLAGIKASKDIVSQEQLELMADAITQRGPDSAGYWLSKDGYVGGATFFGGLGNACESDLNAGWILVDD